VDLSKEHLAQKIRFDSELSDLENIILGRCPDCRSTSTLRCDKPSVIHCSSCGVRFQIGSYFAERE
jgi:ribosomal protein L37AE/L43A